jgi:hypothetical protein
MMSAATPVLDQEISIPCQACLKGALKRGAVEKTFYGELYYDR